MAKGKFWQDGLKFECRQCGNCCTFPGGSVYASEREFRRIADHLEICFEEFLDRFTEEMDGYVSLISVPEGPCVFYKDGCSIYDMRPTQCRTFPFWDHVLKGQHRWDDEAAQCHGMNYGKLWRPNEIREQLKQGEQALMKARSKSE
jgi:uncharacterized protein